MNLERNIFLATSRYVAIDLIGDIIYFPIWWYSVGLMQVAKNLYFNLRQTANNLALKSLALNVFKPMFGQYDREGRIISFFMRIVLLFARLVYFVIKAIILLVVFLFWLIIPVIVIDRLWAILIL